MTKLKNALIIGGGVLLLGLLGTLTNRGSMTSALHAADNGPVVTIGGPLPLSTTAAQNGAWSVGIAGTPNVNVANTPGVNINNTPNVAVTNAATQPVLTSSVDNPGRTPYQFFQNLQLCTSVCQVTTPAVPTGKRLVVQHVSAFGALTNPGTFVEVVVTSGAAVISTFAPSVFGKTGNQGFAFDQTVLGYVDGGQTVTVFMSSDGSLNNTASDFVVTGYLIDCGINQCAPIVP